jgi:hypothetical protein
VREKRRKREEKEREKREKKEKRRKRMTCFWLNWNFIFPINKTAAVVSNTHLFSFSSNPIKMEREEKVRWLKSTFLCKWIKFLWIKILKSYQYIHIYYIEEGIEREEEGEKEKKRKSTP